MSAQERILMPTDPNPTDAFAKELARVADLHRQLDHVAATGAVGPFVHLTDTIGTIHEYTREEIRDWPKAKAALVETLAKPANDRVVMACGRTGLNADEWDRMRVGSVFFWVETKDVARGLCLYRSMLGPVATEPVKECAAGWQQGPRGYWGGPGCSAWGDGGHAIASPEAPCPSACRCGLTFAQAQERGYIPRSAQPPAAEVGKAEQNNVIQASPYQGRDPDNAERIRELMQTDPEVMSRNEAARLRNIAALSKELAEPMSKRRARLARKYDGRPGIDDTGGFSGPGWEE